MCHMPSVRMVTSADRRCAATVLRLSPVLAGELVSRLASLVSGDQVAQQVRSHALLRWPSSRKRGRPRASRFTEVLACAPSWQASGVLEPPDLRTHV